MENFAGVMAEIYRHQDRQLARNRELLLMLKAKENVPVTEFQRLAHAAEWGILYAKGQGGDFTPAWVLCDWLQERSDPRVDTLRYTLTHCEEHAALLYRLVTDAKAAEAVRFTAVAWDHDFIGCMIAHHKWLKDTNKRVMLLLANREAPPDPEDFKKATAPSWIDAIPPKE